MPVSSTSQPAARPSGTLRSLSWLAAGVLITDDWMAALDCHRSQFDNPDKPRQENQPAVRDVFATYASYWGWQIGVKYAQAYLATGPLKIGDPMMLVKDVVPRP